MPTPIHEKPDDPSVGVRRDHDAPHDEGADATDDGGQRQHLAAHAHVQTACGRAGGWSGSLKRSTTTQRWATVNEIMAPNAYRSARNVVLPGTMSSEATAPKMMMATYGVSRVGCTRATMGGICL